MNYSKKKNRKNEKNKNKIEREFTIDYQLVKLEWIFH